VEIAGGQVVNIVAPGGINITGPLAVDGTVSIDGAVSIDGNVGVTGDVSATEDGVFQGISVHNHFHTETQPGTGVTGPAAG
jgi:cytoskeletal protein CcmA (bactofilin family)